MKVGKNLVLFGDSITAGADLRDNGSATSRISLSYGTQLNLLTSYRFNRPPAEHNFGLNGDTTTGMLARIAEVLAAKPQIVVMPCGTNDGDRIETVDNVVEMARIFNEAGAIVLWPSIIPRPFLKTGIFSDPAIALGINQRLRHHAETTCGFFYVDQDQTMIDLRQPTWTVKDGHLSDGSHLSPAGGSPTPQ